MRRYDFYIVNVFAESHFGGNPLAVFPQADGLNKREMQLIARQFNLSESVFLQVAENKSAVKKLNIFTPDYELPFAGHPTVGASFVLHRHFHAPKQYQLETLSGLVAVEHEADGIRFALNNGVKSRESGLSKQDAAAFLGLQEQDIALEPVWINTGSWQLLVRLNSQSAVENCHIFPARFLEKTAADFAHANCYVWYKQGAQVHARMFFTSGGAVLEDPGTGSAAANLGGWHWLAKEAPIALSIYQGDTMGRPNRLSLALDESGIIFVGGKVVEVATGSFVLPQSDLTE